MMSTKTAFVGEKKGSNSNRKGELFKDLVKQFMNFRVDFASTIVTPDGSYCLQVLTNALWYIINYHLTINKVSKQTKEVFPIPKLFQGYVGYNEIKRKKVRPCHYPQTYYINMPRPNVSCC